LFPFSKTAPISLLPVDRFDISFDEAKADEAAVVMVVVVVVVVA
jgi:hypothetical protein